VNRPLWLWCGVIFALAGIAQRRLHESNAVEWHAFSTNTVGINRSPLEDYSVYS